MFVVREIDVKIIRNKHITNGYHKTNNSSTNNVQSTTTTTTTNKATSTSSTQFLTEQAIRASVRQTVLNMSLQLESGSKQEIQYLKYIDILGKRAPSCSLLDGYDMCRLLDAFSRTYIANILRNIVDQIIKYNNKTLLLPPQLHPNDIAVPVMSDIDNIMYNNNSNNVEFSNSVLPAVKKQITSKRRKLQRQNSDMSIAAGNTNVTTQQPKSYNRKRTMSDVTDINTNNNDNDNISSISSKSDNSNSSKTSTSSSRKSNNNGLDTLLHALSGPSSSPTQQSQPVLSTTIQPIQATLLHTNTNTTTAITPSTSPLLSTIQSSPQSLNVYTPLQRPFTGRTPFITSFNLTNTPISTLPPLPSFVYSPSISAISNNSNNSTSSSSILSPPSIDNNYVNADKLSSPKQTAGSIVTSLPPIYPVYMYNNTIIPLTTSTQKTVKQILEGSNSSNSSNSNITIVKPVDNNTSSSSSINSSSAISPSQSFEDLTPDMQQNIINQTTQQQHNNVVELQTV